MFENFPNSSVFVEKKTLNELEDGRNLKLCICNGCGHIQLGNDKNLVVYDQSYSYSERGLSNSVSKDVEYTFSILHQLINEQKLKNVLEIGANNLNFLNNLKFCKKKIAIDPVNFENLSENIENYVCLAEDIDKDILALTDLFISRHNLEHIFDPNIILENINIANKNKKPKYFFVEVPNTESLINNNRIDQIFFDHVHYFFDDTLIKIFNKHNFELIKKWKNDRYGGSLCVLFKSNYSLETKIEFDHKFSSFRSSKFRESYEIFLKKCETLRKFMELNYGNCYGYGAGHSLPFLAYHIDGRFHHLEGIYEDDESKKNKIIRGIIPPILDVNLIKKNHKILITATDYSNEIVQKLDKDISVSGLVI